MDDGVTSIVSAALNIILRVEVVVTTVVVAASVLVGAVVIWTLHLSHSSMMRIQRQLRSSLAVRSTTRTLSLVVITAGTDAIFLIQRWGRCWTVQAFVMVVDCHALICSLVVAVIVVIAAPMHFSCERPWLPRVIRSKRASSAVVLVMDSLLKLLVGIWRETPLAERHENILSPSINGIGVASIVVLHAH